MNRESLYFSSAEFMLMLEMAGGPDYSLYRTDSEPDRVSLIHACSTLYQRGFLRNDKNEFHLSEQGEIFHEIRLSPFIALIRTTYPQKNTAFCYIGEKRLWLVELANDSLANRYRLQSLNADELQEWLFDGGILNAPTLTKADAEELSNRFSMKREIFHASFLLKIERYRNGGNRISQYGVLEGTCGLFLWQCENGQSATELYTKEALSQMLSRALRKGMP